jgi:hypothetical protein
MILNAYWLPGKVSLSATARLTALARNPFDLASKNWAAKSLLMVCWFPDGFFDQRKGR